MQRTKWRKQLGIITAAPAAAVVVVVVVDVADVKHQCDSGASHIQM